MLHNVTYCYANSAWGEDGGILGGFRAYGGVCVTFVVGLPF